MTRRLFLLLSLGLNGALALTFWHLWTIPHAPTPLALPARTLRLSDPSPALESAHHSQGTMLSTNLHWNDLASTDFFRYRDNLRASGCPEPTVRDILESELDHWLFEQRQPILNSLQSRFWGLAAQRGEDAFDEFISQLEMLNGQRGTMLVGLLGEPHPDPTLESKRLHESVVGRFHWLPPELQAQLLQLEQQHLMARRQLQTELSHPDGSAWTPEETKRWEQLRSDHEAAQRALLGDFAEDYDLRISGYAWASRLVGFEPTEDEWRAVTKAEAELSAVMRQNPSGLRALMLQRYGIIPGSPDYPTPEPQPDLADAQARYQASIQAAFGPERYAEYQRAGDETFHQTRRVTQRLGFDDAVAVETWEIRRDTQAAVDQIRANPELDAALRQAALDQIAAESRAILRSTLGEQGFDAYQEYAGSWLSLLGVRSQNLTIAP